ALQAAKHAVTLRASNGAEILLHVGVDTVAFGGEGFEAHVVQGQDVRVGDPLLTFDLDGLAPRVRSSITPVIIINGGGFAVVRREQQRTVRVGDFLMELQSLGETASSGAVVVPGPEIRKYLRVPYEHGIHARPAALLAAALRGFSADVSALAHGRKANARSAVAWMQLGVRRGDEITLIAVGRDAEAALGALETALAAPSARPAGAPPALPLRSGQASAAGPPAASPAAGSSVLRGII